MNYLIPQSVIAQIDASLNQKQGIRAHNDITAIKTWLLEFESSTNTFTSYRQCAERFMMWILQHNLTLSQIKREDIHDYQIFLANPTPTALWCGPAMSRNNPHWKPFVKGLSNASIHLNLQILTTMYEYLVQSGYLTLNPFRLIKKKSARLLTMNRTIERYLNHKEWDIIISYIENIPANNLQQQRYKQRIKWIFHLLYLSGCRRSEIINAKMSDFINKHSQWWLRVIGKGNKYGEIPVTNALLLALIEYRKSLGLTDLPNTLETNISLINNIKYIANKLTPISDSMLYKIIKTTCTEIADTIRDIDPSSAFIIEKVSTHWLRHTSATHQVDAGIDIRIVKENLRHSLLETTMRYQHTDGDTRHMETIKKFGKE